MEAPLFSSSRWWEVALFLLLGLLLLPFFLLLYLWESLKKGNEQIEEKADEDV